MNARDAAIAAAAAEIYGRFASQPGDSGNIERDVVKAITTIISRRCAASTQYAAAIKVLVAAKEEIALVGKQGRSARNGEIQRRQAIYVRGWDDAIGALTAALAPAVVTPSAEVLVSREEAAKVADACADKWLIDARNIARANDLVGGMAQSTYTMYAEIATGIANTIRALPPHGTKE